MTLKAILQVQMPSPKKCVACGLTHGPHAFSAHVECWDARPTCLKSGCSSKTCMKAMVLDAYPLCTEHFNDGLRRPAT